MRKAEEKVAEKGAFDDDRYRLFIEKEFEENGQYIMQYIGGVLTTDVVHFLFEILAEQNFKFARANDYPDEDPSLNLFFVDNGNFSFVPLLDTYIDKYGGPKIENGDALQKELDKKGVAFFNEVYDRWLEGVRIEAENQLIYDNVTALKDGVIKLYLHMKSLGQKQKQKQTRKQTIKESWWRFW